MKNKKCPTGLQSRPGCETERASHENTRKHSTNRKVCQTYKGLMRMENDKPGYWAVIPAGVRYDPELPPSAKLLYAEISSLTDAAGYCFASNAYFERLYDLSERTIIRLLRILERRGWIRTEENTGGKATRKIYAGVNPAAGAAADPLTKMSVPPDKNVSTTLTKMSPPTINKKINNKSISSPQSPPGGGDGSGIWDKEAFDRFWAMYPKKRDKAKAIKEWNRLKADRKLMRRMSAALGAQMASEEWQRDNGRAIPYPCRWLSHRRWEDELGVEIPQQKEDDRVWL